jgi:methyl-accepting chemotaxis protein
MNEIVRLVNGVTNVIDKISAASVEQSEGIGNVTDAVRQIDETTQQNAAVVERAAHSATRLDEEARKLVDALGVFKIAAAEEVFIS